MDHKPTVADDGFPRTGSIRPPAAWSAPSARGSTSGRSRRGLLGAGLVEVPPVPYRDPAEAVLKDPVVAERRRFCRCGEPVGRGRGGRPGRTEGYCPRCGSPFSFLPKLRPGELVGGQYEVLGCLAHGGLGWVYLARDRNVNDRWVVLKGLLDTGDPAAGAVAAAEKAFLAEVEHPNIVRIYNFVQHPEPRTFAMVGYIVMEYVGGKSLKDVLLQHREEHGPDTALPLAQAIAYALEVLRAMGYLHALGLLYCDLKPDNAIQAEEQLKLIDLGGVRRMEDFTSAIYGTVGYQAPEISGLGPSVSSDLFTVGRTLAVLSFPFRRFTTTYVADLPPREQVDVLREHESYDRFLRRACSRDPFARFTDAGEMAEQLTGVLREVLSAQDEEPRPAPSTLFGPERHTVTGELTPKRAVQALPVPLIAGAAGPGGDDPVAVLAALAAAGDASPEALLRQALAHIELGGRDAARALLAPLRDDWRAGWCLAMAALAAGDAAEAAAAFDALYALLPGELAPKLGLAFCCELLGDLDSAARRYLAVWRTGRSHVSAAFGLSRVRLAGGDRPGAVAALDSVPAVSSHRQAAGMAAVRALVLGRAPAELTEEELLDAGHRLDRLRLDAERHGRLAAEVLDAALGWVLAGHRSTARLLGDPLTERGLRKGLERTYRTLARLCDDTPERHRLIARANAVRPRTLL
ncbi:serine/threonine-protein kinase PknG [Actinocorallia sp. API 0066]|uniref:serine/threonine-protein kinase n=1 Tax=Actinocorallia sp. API 0066 TaxID=2896846 RepID=UPI001E357295|nr:serine/threonine-protein kinase [Actinocorallia sp. API 0066]MCD0448452.1 serine/threonine-protein kinase PknG [Actinocorallia sp. API 0066]